MATNQPTLVRFSTRFEESTSPILVSEAPSMARTKSDSSKGMPEAVNAKPRHKDRNANKLCTLGEECSPSVLKRFCSPCGFTGAMGRLPTLHVDNNRMYCKGWDSEVRQMFEPLENSKAWEDSAAEELHNFKQKIFYWKGPHIQKTRYTDKPLRSPQLAGYKSWVGVKITDISVKKPEVKKVDEQVLILYFDLVDLPGKPPRPLSCRIFVELNTHRLGHYFDDVGDIMITKPRANIYMYGETYQCAAALLLIPNIGVNVVLGESKKPMARRQIAFLKSIDADRVTFSDECMMEGGIKLRLDQLSPLIADEFQNNAKQTCDMLCEKFTASALARITSLKRDQRSLVDQLLINELKKLPKPIVMIQNRMTETANYEFLNLLPSYLAFLLQICSIGGVKTVIIAGDPIFGSLKDKRRQVIDSERGNIEKIILLNKVYEHPSFHKCFGEEAFISGQAWLLDALRPHLAAVMGPHSGSTESAALLGLPTIIFSPDDHTSHPRIPRIADACQEWWKLIGCGTLEDMGETQDLLPEGKEAICNALEKMLFQYAGGSSAEQHAPDEQDRVPCSRVPSIDTECNRIWLDYENSHLISPSKRRVTDAKDQSCRTPNAPTEGFVVGETTNDPDDKANGGCIANAQVEHLSCSVLNASHRDAPRSEDKVLDARVSPWTLLALAIPSTVSSAIVNTICGLTKTCRMVWSRNAWIFSE